MNNRQEVLDRFIKHVVSQAKKNLTTSGKNASKKLYNSIQGEAKAFPNSIGIYFDMEEYGFYQDQGVEGTKSGKSFSNFKYTNKMPPPKAFDKWVVRRGIAPRTSSGKFKSRKSLQFAMAMTIFQKGIKPSLFFTKPFEAAYKNLPDELIDKYGLDVIELFDSIMKPNFKK